MKDKLFLLFLLLTPLSGAPPSREGLAVQELLLRLDECERKVHGQKVDLEIALERIQSLESTIKSLEKELGTTAKGDGEWAKGRLSQFEKKLLGLEKAQEAFVSDLKTLKTHQNETITSLSLIQDQLLRVDQQVSQDTKNLKNSLQSVVSLLQDGSETAASSKTYTVKDGDSLGKIAIDHHTTVKKIKELNQLQSDRIFLGQKLRLP